MSLLSSSQAQEAITYTKQRYNVRSIRIFQVLVGTEADGDFGIKTAEAIAQFQQERGFPDSQIDGKPGAKTIDALMKRSPIKSNDSKTDLRALTAAEYVHLVADLNNLPIQEALTVRLCESSTKQVQTQFETGKNSIVCLGFSAFSSHNVLRDAIQTGLDVEAPNSTISNQPNLLNNVQQTSAITYNSSKLTDIRAIRIVQELVKAVPDGKIGVGTVERLAQFQSSKGLSPNGKLDIKTLQKMYESLIERKHFNSIIYLLINFFALDKFFSVGLGLLELSIDDNLVFSGHVAAGGVTWSRANVLRRSCAIIRIRSSSLGGNLGNAIRVLVHELAHMQQDYKPRQEFVVNNVEDAGLYTTEMEFLAWSQSVIHPGLPRSEDVRFFGDATRIAKFWKDLSTKQKQFYWSRFQTVRNAVHQQFDTLPNKIEPQQKEAFQETVNVYDNEPKP